MTVLQLAAALPKAYFSKNSAAPKEKKKKRAKGKRVKG